MNIPGEREAVMDALRIGDRYGYGNLIAHLKRAWANMLKNKYGLSEEVALKGADTSAFPPGFDPLNVFGVHGDGD